MAYSASGLSAISYSNGFTLWHYRTPDTAEDVLAPGYFDPARQMLRPGDFMFANFDVDRERQHGVLVVSDRDESSVSVFMAIADAKGDK